MKRWLQFSLASLLAIPLIVALDLFAYKARAAQVELQDRFSFIDKHSHLSESTRSFYRKIVSNEENRPYFASLNLVRNSEAHVGNSLYSFEKLLPLKDNTVIILNTSFSRPSLKIFQLDRTHKIHKYIDNQLGINNPFQIGSYKSHRIEGDSLKVKFDGPSTLNVFEIDFDYAE